MGKPHFNRGMSPKMEKNVTFPVTMVPWSCFVVFLTGENPVSDRKMEFNHGEIVMLSVIYSRSGNET